nr:RNA-directed DNA polymerase, eukaryota, reverse transcriptase zinc-binding domain protein [Tanacetum cinerariifolium]
MGKPSFNTDAKGWTWIFRNNKNPKSKIIDNPYNKDLERFATSFYVSNLPDSLDAKGLWKACLPYGRLVMPSLLINAQKEISVTIKVEVNGELFDVNVLEIGTWNTNITDTASDVSSQMEANHLDKDDISVKDKENDDLDDIGGILKDLDNDAKNEENVFVSPKEVVPDQPIKKVEEDILKQPEE